MISLSAGILKGKASSLHSQLIGLASGTAGVLVCGYISPIGWAGVTWNGSSLAGTACLVWHDKSCFGGMAAKVSRFSGEGS